MVYCTKCGGKNPDIAIYCRSCGAKIEKQVNRQPEITLANEYEKLIKKQPEAKASRANKKYPKRNKWIKPLLILVVSVFVILVAGLTASYFIGVGSAEAYSRDCMRTNDIYNLKLALSIYHTDNGAYPDALRELAGKYMDELPKDPLEGKPVGNRLVEDELRSSTFSYVYRVTDDGESFELKACMEWKGKKVVGVGPYE
jgi:hypothetical protein